MGQSHLPPGFVNNVLFETQSYSLACAFCLKCLSPCIYLAYSLTSQETPLSGYFAGEVFPDHPKIPPLAPGVPFHLDFISPVIFITIEHTVFKYMTPTNV